MQEFAFELRLCCHLESEGIVARQLGGGVRNPGHRVIDTIFVEPGSEFSERAALTPQSIPENALRADVPVGRAVTRQKAFAELELPPERQRSIIDRAVEIGFFERDRREGRIVLRQVRAYPASWFDSLTAIENKPDLSTPGKLAAQLRFDVALALFDRVVLATESHVTGAHLNRLPDPVGVWRLQKGDFEVIREPERLSTECAGIEIVETAPSRTDVVTVSGAEKRRIRRRIAERAYGKGFRTYDFPACARASQETRDGLPALPYCRLYERIVDPRRECGPDCQGYQHTRPLDVDFATVRDKQSPWVAHPDGFETEQSRLDRFGTH